MDAMDARNKVYDEFWRSMEKHPNFNSHHEAYSVILEEMDEYWEEVKKGGSHPRSPEALRAELIQVAAMALKGLVSLC